MTNVTPESVKALLDPPNGCDADGWPLTRRNGCCMICNQWTPRGHREAHDHLDDCAAAASGAAWHAQRSCTDDHLRALLQAWEERDKARAQVAALRRALDLIRRVIPIGLVPSGGRLILPEVDAALHDTAECARIYDARIRVETLRRAAQELEEKQSGVRLSPVGWLRIRADVIEFDKHIDQNEKKR